MRKAKLLLIAVFLLGLAVSVVAYNGHKPRLLILQSYDGDYAWSREVNVGIERVLKKEDDFLVRWFYMDTKRHPWEDYKVNAGIAVHKVIDSWQPDVVIAVDDDAQRYAMADYVNQPKIRIVYSGVNGEPEDYGYDKARNVTGILERKPYRALRETLLLCTATQKRTHPLRIMFLGDRSESVRSDERYFRQMDWRPIEVLDSHLVDTFDEWRQAVDLAGRQGVDFIVTANYRKILRAADDKTLVPAREILEWTAKHSRIPLVGTNAFFVEDGGMLAIGTSPYEQGEVAAAMAREMLTKGKPAGAIPAQASGQFVVAMRASQLKAAHVELPAVYEAAARAAGNFYP